MKKVIFTKLFIMLAIGVFAQVQNTAPGVYVGPTGFVDNFTNSVTSWQDSAYFWTADQSVYSLSQTGNGKLTVNVTAGSPTYQSFAAYGINDEFDPIDISGVGNRKVTVTITNSSTTQDANVRIILMGIHNRDTVDINSSAAANSGGWGTWFKVSPPLAASETRTVIFDFSTPYLEHTSADNTRFPNNICNSGSPDYYASSGACVSSVAIDSIIGFRMWINAGANANLSQWPNYGSFTGTITIDKLVIGSDPSVNTGVLKSSAYLATSEVFPNPTAGKSELNFSLKNSSQVKIDIKDSRGMLVNTIYNEKMKMGEHRLPISTENLENGFYQLTLQFEDGSTHTEKLIILK